MVNRATESTVRWQANGVTARRRQDHPRTRRGIWQRKRRPASLGALGIGSTPARDVLENEKAFICTNFENLGICMMFQGNERTLVRSMRRVIKLMTTRPNPRVRRHKHKRRSKSRLLVHRIMRQLNAIYKIIKLFSFVVFKLVMKVCTERKRCRNSLF